MATVRLLGALFLLYVVFRLAVKVWNWFTWVAQAIWDAVVTSREMVYELATIGDPVSVV